MVSLYWILLPELYFRLELHTDFSSHVIEVISNYHIDDSLSATLTVALLQGCMLLVVFTIHAHSCCRQ